jgi:pyruvate formate-lyase activating enzyme-like uncharacterized protein
MSNKVASDILSSIKNPIFREYAKIYSNIYANYLEQIQAKGLKLDEYRGEEQAIALEKLRQRGVAFRNEGKSLYLNWISPACEACRKGINSLTFFISLMCHRHCYYCFNPNQEDYAYFRENKRDCQAELAQLAKSGQKVSYLALTGGEPLLHHQETIDFFTLAQEKFRRAHTRLYTSGDLLDQDILQQLQDAGLDEVRFSVKLEDDPQLRKKVYDRISLAKEYIPNVLVEMPVIPGTLQEMKELLRILDNLGIEGINLLEFCFPFHNREHFQKESFKVKNPPFLTLYDYWYAGGLPISQSELECLKLLEFALDQELSIGVHYCSLENKHTGQVYQQNLKQKSSGLAYLSPKDYFLKTAKVFGEDIPTVLRIFKRKNNSQFQINGDHQFLEFHVKEVKTLKGLDLEVGISSSILEERSDGTYLRELKIDLTYPEIFDIRAI